ncbi:MAG: hypothetical protein IKU10_07405, partial [Clostridia bacterium]|nr:hypothetical protein [Clostridia bacterium]
MKICKACSAYNSDDRTHCVDCGERLGAPLGEEEAAAIQQAMKEKTDRLCNGQDPTHVNGYDLVLGCLQGAGLVVSLLIWVLGFVQDDCVPYMVGALVAF